MILHLLTDEKFSDYAIRQFSAPEMESEFVVVEPEERAFKHISLGDSICRVDPSTERWRNLLSNLGDYSAVVLHGLFWPWNEDVLRTVPDDVKVAWMFWGGEIYGRSDVRMPGLMPLAGCAQFVHNVIKAQATQYAYEVPKELICRIDYCLTDEDEEYEFVRRWLGSDIKMLRYNYYSVEQTLGELKNSRCCGTNLLIGNSASAECNQLDILLWLKRIGCKNQLTLPLSYGKPWVRNAVIRFARFLKLDVHPLVDFMPLSQYNMELQDCSTMIMAHYRPQAQGNIITGMWLGMRVYLSEKNLTFAYFKRLGFRVFSLENDLRGDQSDKFAPLPEIEMEHNRRLLMKYYGSETVMSNVRTVVNELKDKKHA